MKKTKTAPLFISPVQAGFPSPAEDFLEQALDLNEHLIRHPAATFFVRVNGESMKGAGIQNRDLLIVDRSLEAADGNIVVAVINGEFTVKRLKICRKTVRLVAENPDFPPISIPEGADFQIWGVVTTIIHSAIP